MGHLIGAGPVPETPPNTSLLSECRLTTIRRRRWESQLCLCHSQVSRMGLMAIVQCHSSCMASWHRCSDPGQGCKRWDKRFRSRRSCKIVSLTVRLTCHPCQDLPTLQLVARSSSLMPGRPIATETSRLCEDGEVSTEGRTGQNRLATLYMRRGTEANTLASGFPQRLGHDSMGICH
jgi:hypothetical protein